jgi:hypothetical protein
MAKAKDKFGEGPSSEDLISPIHVGPSKGQEGWTPANPTFGQPRDPLGYLKPESGSRD